MADFKTTLERLSRRETSFEAVARNIETLLRRKPQAAVGLMDQLKEAVGAEVIDAETYARLRTVVTRNLQAPPDSEGKDDARTLFGQAPADGQNDGERTEVVARTGTDEATEMLGRDDISDIDFDASADTGSGTSSSWSDEVENDTGTSWNRPATPRAGPQLRPGMVLRGRFQLDEILGQGGMGSVYLGRDLIKVRAKDKQPRVALKVLNEDFKQHPDSFIALQREASRQQRLAHPNIATVYDFDQTEDGTAFLVMELLEGQPLNDFIKRTVKPRGGLPFAEALPMVQGLGNALIYAHERNIVHSDFKPGNCFITSDGAMKVLDFGIARAVKAPGAAEGETTIFDASKLGALTPAYASLEMLEGKEPDPRDDIYALACVTYELLTGKHPFNKIPANKARDAGLAPEPVKGLTRKQWRGLQRGLAFAREQRSQSTAEFLEDFEGATTPWKNPFVIGPAIAALIVIAGFFPARNYLQARDIEQRIAMARTGDPAQIEAMLAALDADDVGEAQRDRIFTVAKDEVLAYFDARARERFDVARQHYDFDGARSVLGKARALSPVFADSSRLDELRQDIEESENRLFAEQFDKFNRALASGSLLAVAGEEDIFDAMAVVRQVDPGHAMLTDRRLPGAYAEAIGEALENEDYEYADELSQIGLALIPDSANLSNLTDKIAGARDRAETRGRILAAIADIQRAEDAGGSLADFAGVGEAVADLATADPSNPLLEKLREQLTPLVRKDLATLEARRDWGASGLIQGQYKGLLRGLGLHELNARAASLGAEFGQVVDAARADVTAAVAAGDLARAAGERLARLAALAPASERTQNARDQVANAWLQAARRARDDDQAARALDALDAALEAAPRAVLTVRVERERARVTETQALDASTRAARASERQARFDAAMPALVERIDALVDDREAFAAAFAAHDELAALAPAEPGLEALSTRLAEAVRAGAARLGEAGRWDDAVALGRAALIELPGSSQLADSLAELEQARDAAIAARERAQVAEAKSRIESLLAEADTDRDWRTEIRRHMETIVALGEPGDPWLRENGTRVGAALIARAAAMRAEQRLAEGANLLADAARYAPGAPGLAEEQAALDAATAAFEREQAEQARLARIDGLKETFQTQARANDAAGAQQTLDALREELGDDTDPFVSDQAPRLLAAAYFKLASQRAAASDFAAALRFAKACATLQPQRLDCKNAVRDYTVDGNRQELGRIFNRGGSYDLTEVMDKIAEVQMLDPGVFSQAESDWAGAVQERLEALKASAGTGANELIGEAKTLFAGNRLIAAIEPVELEVPPSQYAAEVIAAMDKALLARARDLLKEANETESDHPDIVRLKGAYNARVGEAKELYETYKSQYLDGDYESALATMEEALTVWADSSTFKKEHARVVAKLGELSGASGQPGASVIAAALPPTDPCEARLAGHGKRRKGTCYYFVSGNQRSPLLVVVPAGGEFAAPFAIGKYEVTVSDFNRYCVLSGACDPRRDREGRLPVTDISIAQARAYVEWLAERTGQPFRLPTAAEWAYAAQAGGEQPKKDYNCRVEQNGQLLKGQGTMGVNTGRPNGWGLYNYIGNVQEWAVAGDGVVARGGAFEDTFSKCDIGLEKSHDGSADAVTGFRVALDLR